MLKNSTQKPNRTRSLNSQFSYAIGESCAFSQSKRSAKYDKISNVNHKIFSFSYFSDISETSSNFAQYVKAYYSDVKRATDITTSLVESYLIYKSESVSDNTINKIYNHIAKLEKCCKKAFSSGAINWDLTKVAIPLSKSSNAYGKDSPMSMDTINDLLNCLKASNRRGNAWKSVILSAWAGLRVNETTHIVAKNVDLTGGMYGFGTVTISRGPSGGAKGGRYREVPVLDIKAQTMLKSAIEGLESDDYVVARIDGKQISSSTVTDIISDALKKIGQHDKGNINHAMRKTFAQMYYDFCRNDLQLGMQESIARVNIALGHGRNRGKSGINTYVDNIW